MGHFFDVTSSQSFNPISNWTVATQNDMLVSPPILYWKPVVLDCVHMERLDNNFHKFILHLIQHLLSTILKGEALLPNWSMPFIWPSLEVSFFNAPCSVKTM